jgi:hypothetical protein
MGLDGMGVRFRINNYDYSMVEYINYYTKIKIICKEHGQFEQTSNNHFKEPDVQNVLEIKKKQRTDL